MKRRWVHLMRLVVPEQDFECTVQEIVNRHVQVWPCPSDWYKSVAVIVGPCTVQIVCTTEYTLEYVSAAEIPRWLGGLDNMFIWTYDPKQISATQEVFFVCTNSIHNSFRFCP
jgi:hypothetical protein